jgi:uncharacterized Zn-finger protein
MAQTVVPHFVNDLGADRIAIGVKEFQCMGAAPPHESEPDGCVYVATAPPGSPAA